MAERRNLADLIQIFQWRGGRLDLRNGHNRLQAAPVFATLWSQDRSLPQLMLQRNK
jgi:hypothetical protein